MTQASQLAAGGAKWSHVGRSAPPASRRLNRKEVKRARRSERRFRIAIAAVALVGLATVLYPPAIQWVEQKAQSRLLADTSTVIAKAPDAQLDALWADAVSYNQELAAGIQPEVPYGATLGLPSVSTMTRLRIPAIDVDQPVRHGMSEEVLSRGLGHMEGSSLPVGGESTNTVIGGHRGLAEAVGFTHLDKVAVGDMAILETLGRPLTYVVQSIEVLPPGQAEIQPVTPGKDLLTLVTCTPLGINTDRLVVVAERLEPVPEGVVAGKKSELPAFPWWLVILLGGALSAAAYVMRPVKDGRPKSTGKYQRRAAQVPAVGGHLEKG